MRKSIAGLMMLAVLASPVLAQYVPYEVDFAEAPVSYDLNTAVGNTPRIRVYLKQSGTNTTPSNWESQLHWAQNDSAPDGTVPVTGYSGSNYIEFSCSSNTFARVIDRGYWAVKISRSNGTENLTLIRGTLNVKRSPEITSTLALQRTVPINWDLINSTGTLPWLAYAVSASTDFWARAQIPIIGLTATQALVLAQAAYPSSNPSGYVGSAVISGLPTNGAWNGQINSVSNLAALGYSTATNSSANNLLTSNAMSSAVVGSVQLTDPRSFTNTYAYLSGVVIRTSGEKTTPQNAVHLAMRDGNSQTQTRLFSYQNPADSNHVIAVLSHNLHITNDSWNVDNANLPASRLGLENNYNDGARRGAELNWDVDNAGGGASLRRVFNIWSYQDNTDNDQGAAFYMRRFYFMSDSSGLTQLILSAHSDSSLYVAGWPYIRTSSDLGDNGLVIGSGYGNIYLQHDIGFTNHVIMAVPSANLVGIGTSTPKTKLDVNGSVRVTGTITGNTFRALAGFYGDGSGLTNLPIAGVSDPYTWTNTVNGSGNSLTGANAIAAASLSVAGPVTVGDAVIGASSTNNLIYGFSTVISNGARNNVIFGNSINVAANCGTNGVLSGQGHSVRVSTRHSFLGGGLNNVIGDVNTPMAYGTLVGGVANAMRAGFGFLGGGQSNEVGTASSSRGAWGVVVGGWRNVVDADYGMILGGYSNQALAVGSAVIGVNGIVPSTSTNSVLVSCDPNTRYTNGVPKSFQMNCPGGVQYVSTSGATNLWDGVFMRVMTNVDIRTITPPRPGAEIYDAGSNYMWRSFTTTTNGWGGWKVTPP